MSKESYITDSDGGSWIGFPLVEEAYEQDSIFSVQFREIITPSFPQN